MFFRNKQPSRGDHHSARSSVLVRESWWLIALAAVGYLALVLGTYHRTDPGWSVSVTGTDIENKGGAFGAWLADLLLYLFGFSAWWTVFAGVFAFWAAYRRIASDAEHDAGHPLLASAGFVVMLMASAAIEAI